MPKHVMTIKMVEEAKKLHAQGMTYKEISEQFGMPLPTINQRCLGRSNSWGIDRLKEENQKLKERIKFLEAELEKKGGIEI